jgi:ABC-type transporter Mla maintaining outer membrane lipid asymmetry ATPase subunit MlaF
VTSIVVTHDMTSAYKVADRIAMLHEGRIVFEGTPEETRASDNPVVQRFIRGESGEFVFPVAATRRTRPRERPLKGIWRWLGR